MGLTPYSPFLFTGETMNPCNYGYESLTDQELIKELKRTTKEYKRLNSLSKNTRLLDERVHVERQASSYFVRMKTLQLMVKSLKQESI